MDPYVLVFSHKHPSCSGQSLFSVQLASIRYITPYVSLFWRPVSPSLQQASVGSLRGLIRTTLLFIARIPIIIFFSLYLQISYIGSTTDIRGDASYFSWGEEQGHTRQRKRKTESRTGDSDGNEDYATQARDGEIKKKQSRYKKAEHSERRRDEARKKGY